MAAESTTTTSCSRCGEPKPLSEFCKRANRKSGYASHCKVCNRLSNKKYYENNKEKVNKRTTEWAKNNRDRVNASQQRRRIVNPEKNKLNYRKAAKKKAGLSLDDFNKQSIKQNNLCAICGLPEIAKGGMDLAIDHNHNTGQVRGLLCVKCNNAIGALNVDNLGILNLQKAIDYLRNPPYASRKHDYHN